MHIRGLISPEPPERALPSPTGSPLGKGSHCSHIEPHMSLRSRLGGEGGEQDKRSEMKEDQTQAGWWLCLDSVQFGRPPNSGFWCYRSWVGWKPCVALLWPLPQGLLGAVASEGLLLSSRASMEWGVGLRNSFLGREIKEKTATDF